MDDIQTLIINNYDKLTESDRFVAKTILNDKNAVHMNTVEDLAAFCSVSKSTIIRFTKKIGLDGFSELKVRIKIDQGLSEEVDENFIDRVCDNDIQVINYYKNYDFTPIINMIESSPEVYAYGTGMFQRSFNIELRRLFMHIDRWIRPIDGEAELELAFKHLKEGDTLIISSSSGKNDFLEKNYDLLKLKGVNILSFTNSARNPLVYASNYNISTELNKETFYDKFYFDSIATMYIPLKIFFARYIDFLVNEYEN